MKKSFLLTVSFVMLLFILGSGSVFGYGENSFAFRMPSHPNKTLVAELVPQQKATGVVAQTSEPEDSKKPQDVTNFPDVRDCADDNFPIIVTPTHRIVDHQPSPGYGWNKTKFIYNDRGTYKRNMLGKIIDFFSVKGWKHNSKLENDVLKHNPNAASDEQYTVADAFNVNNENEKGEPEFGIKHASIYTKRGFYFIGEFKNFKPRFAPIQSEPTTHINFNAL